jgi:hypothetical protein
VFFFKLCVVCIPIKVCYGIADTSTELSSTHDMYMRLKAGHHQKQQRSSTGIASRCGLTSAEALGREPPPLPQQQHTAHACMLTGQSHAFCIM